MNVSVGSPDIPIALRSNDGGPMSTVTRSTVPRSISNTRCLRPARVAMSSSPEWLNPRSCTSLARQRMPFPHISATSPSAL
jgi:hypothetical protein